MKLRILATVVFVYLLAITNAFCFAAEPLSLDDLMAVTNLSEAQISPDGSQVVYVTADADLDENRYRFAMWMVATAGGEPVQLTPGPNDFNPRWSPDGKQIAFLSDRDGIDEIWLLPGGFGEAYRITDVAKEISDFAWSPDGKSILFTAPINALDFSTEERPYVRVERVSEEDKDREQLYLLDVATQECRQLIDRAGHVSSFAWSPNSRTVAYSICPSSRPNDLTVSDLYLVDVSNGKQTLLVQRPGIDAMPSFSPDGKQVAFVSQNGNGARVQQTCLSLVPVSGGKPVNLTSDFDGGISSQTADSFFWGSDSGTIYFGSIQGVRRQLFRLDVNRRSVEPLSSGDQVCFGFSMSADRKTMVLMIDRATMPADLFVTSTDVFKPRGLTELNPDLRDRQFGKVTAVLWKSKDGTPVEGTLIHPVDYKPGKCYPLVTYLHGGPTGGFKLGFSPSSAPAVQVQYCPVQVLAAAGFAVLCPNPRGSDGYGQDFRAAVYQDWGEGDYEDVMTGIDHLIEVGLADPDRLAITGYCYGAYLSACALTKTNRFKAASMGACFANLYALHGQSDLPSSLEAYLGDVPWKAREHYERHSPIFEAHKIRTAVLLQHAERDERVPLAQGREMYSVLKKTEAPVEMIIFPGQGHVIGRPRMQQESMQQNVKWFQRWLQ